MRTWMLAGGIAGVLGSATAMADGPCGGRIDFVEGRVVTGITLTPAKSGTAESKACLREIANRLKARDTLRGATINIRLPANDRKDNKPLALGRSLVAAMVEAGVPQQRINTLVPATDAAEVPNIVITYVDKPAERAVASVVAIAGDVNVGPLETNLHPAVEHAPVPGGGFLKTGANGYARVALVDGSVVTLSANTSVRFGKIDVTPAMQRMMALELQSGSIDADVRAAGQGSTFDINTAIATASVKGTHFRFSVDTAGVSRLETVSGVVALQSGGTSIDVPAGQGARVTKKGLVEKARSLLNAPVLTGNTGWTAVAGAASYVMEISRDAEFLHPYLTLPTTGTQAMWSAEAKAGKWFWRVRAIDADGFVGDASTALAVDAGPAG